MWDSKPLLEANRQLQQLRLYYRFPSAAVDRYPLGSDPARQGSQMVFIAARELDTGALPKDSRTWLNRHLVFTHGYGFTVSPVNAFGPDGLPLYFVKDLGRSGRVQGIPQLGLPDSTVRQALPVGRPRLYFGSAKAPYVIAPTKVREFDYSEGELNIYSHYGGAGGVAPGFLDPRLLGPWRPTGSAPTIGPGAATLCRSDPSLHVRLASRHPLPVLFRAGCYGSRR